MTEQNQGLLEKTSKQKSAECTPSSNPPLYSLLYTHTFPIQKKVFLSLDTQYFFYRSYCPIKKKKKAKV